MMIYFTKINSFICIFQGLCKLFINYYLLEATLNACILEIFFAINLFSLINGKAVLLYHNRVRLSDAAHRNMNQTSVFFTKNTYFR